MKKTFIEKEHSKLLAKFHILLANTGKPDFIKELILEQFGVTSSKELSAHQLMDICNELQKKQNPELKELDLLRKQVMASIGAYLKAMKKQESSEIIKAIACRAAKEKNFNQIPISKLRGIYKAFNYYKEAMISVAQITEDILLKQE